MEHTQMNPGMIGAHVLHRLPYKEGDVEVTTVWQIVLNLLRSQLTKKVRKHEGSHLSVEILIPVMLLGEVRRNTLAPLKHRAPWRQTGGQDDQEVARAGENDVMGPAPFRKHVILEEGSVSGV